MVRQVASAIWLVLACLSTAACRSGWQTAAVATGPRSRTLPLLSLRGGRSTEKLERHEREQLEQQRQLTIGRYTTVFNLFLVSLVNGLARRALASSMPRLVANGQFSESDAEAISFLGFQGFHDFINQ